LVARGWDHFYNVEYEAAIADFQKAVDADPNDPNRRNALAEAILFQMMYKAGALETEFATGSNPFLRRGKMNPTPEEEQRFAQAIEATLNLCEARLRRDPKDLDAMYAEGVALGLRGNYNFLVRKAWFDALRDITAGRRLHNRLSELDPTRVDARLLQGVHDYIVGSLPTTYKFLGFLAGFHGDRAQGIKTLQLVAQQGVMNKVDAEILLGVIYRREKQPASAIPICNDLLRRFPRNVLVLFELSQMYGDMGDKQNALAALDRIEQLKKSGAAGYKTIHAEKLNYARGNILFWFDDLNPAVEDFKSAAARSQELDPYTGVMAWMRLGQCYDLMGRRDEALKAYSAAIAYAPESDAAKESKRYITSPYRRVRPT
jgi:tetratricopeptide (TPR) repeat protein